MLSVTPNLPLVKMTTLQHTTTTELQVNPTLRQNLTRVPLRNTKYLLLEVVKHFPQKQEEEEENDLVRVKCNQYVLREF